MEDNLQGTSQQLLNEDGTIKNWEGEIDPRIIRERYEFFICEDLPNVDMKVDFEDTLMRIHDGGLKRRIITDHAEWENIILRSNGVEGGLKQKITIRKKES